MSEQDKKQKQLDTLKGLMNNANYSRGVGEIKNDLWQDIKSGLVAVPQAGVGLLSLTSGGHVGKFVEDNIWDMQKAQENIHAQKSATAQAQQRQFDDAKGFGAKLGTIIKNPMMAVDAAVESTPSMLAGGVIGRGIGKAAGIKSAALRAGVGEGTIMAGSAAENMRSQNDDGLLTGKEAIASLGTGVIGAGVGYGGSRLAGKLGVGDADSLLAGGVREINQNATQGGLTNGLKGIGKGAISEGVFEELPQTLAETALDNWANGRALSENMAGNAAMGLAAGATMGGVVGGATSQWTKDNPPQDNLTPSTPQLGYRPNPTAPTGGGAVAMPSNPNGGTVIDENGTMLSSSTEQSTLPQAVYTLANAINDYQGVDEPSAVLAQNLLTHIEQNGIDVQTLTDSTDKQEALAQVLKSADPSVFANADSFGQFIAQHDYISQFRATPKSQINNETVTAPTTQQTQVPTADDYRAYEARRGINPNFGERVQKPSEQLGLDPNAGALSKSAVVAVDSGASAIGQKLHAEIQQSVQEPSAHQDQYQDKNEQAQNFANAPKLMGKQHYIQNQNERLPTQLMVVEADTLTPSTDNTQNQARDRNRTTSRLQVDNIANNLDPAQLADSTTMTHGSPTITDDGTIIAGNGRTMALKQAFAQGRGEEYRQMLIDKADDYGLDKTALSQMKNPVLVKSVGNIHPDKLRQLALNSNETGTMTQSAFETARADVGRVAKVNLDNLKSDDAGNINTPSNKHIINEFISQFPIEQQNALRQADGTLSKQGLERFENALLLSAYGDNPTTQAILESTDLALKNAIKALASTAPSVAKTKQGIQEGIIPNDDIARDITEALSVLAKLRRDNIKPSDYLAQTSLFGDELSDTGKRLLDFMDKNIRSVVKIRQLLYKYYANLSKENLNQNDMFGKPAQTKQTRLNQALKELGYEEFIQPTNSEPVAEYDPTAKSRQPTTQQGNTPKSISQSATLNERPQKSEGNGQSVGRDGGTITDKAGNATDNLSDKVKPPVQTTTKPKNLKEGLKLAKAKRQQMLGEQKLRADWGVETIGNFETTDEFPADLSKENSDPIKEAFLKDSQNYLGIVQSLMEERGYSLYKNPKGKPEKISINTGGSGEATLVMHKDRVNVYVKVSASAIKTKDAHPQGVQLLYRAFKGDYKNRFSGGHNHFDNAILSTGELAQTLDDLAQKQIAHNKVDFSLAINDNAIDNLSDEEVKEVLAMFDTNQASKDKALTKGDERSKIANLTKEQDNAKRPTTVQPPNRVLADTPSDGVGADTNGRTPSSVHFTSGKPSEPRDENQPTTGDDRKRSTGVLSDGDKAGLSSGVVFGERKGLFELPPILVTTIDTQSLGFKDTKKLADDILRQLQGTDNLINDDTGWVLSIGKKDRQKMGDNKNLSHSASQAVQGIQTLVKNAIVAETHQDIRHGNEHVKAVHRLYVPALIDGQLHRVKLTVKDYTLNDGTDRKNLRAIEAVEIENVLLGTLPSDDEQGTAQPTTGHSVSIANLLKGVKHDGDDRVFGAGLTSLHKSKKSSTQVLVAPEQSQSTDETSETLLGRKIGNNVSSKDKTVNTTKALDNALQATNQADFSLSAQMVQTGSVKDKLATNIAIIELLKDLEESRRTPTLDEKALMAKYTGFGGLSKAFADSQGSYAKGFEELGVKLRQLLSKDAYDSAKASSTSAFFTPPNVINAMWDIAKRLGYNGGVVLEPSAGVGAFIGHAPKNLPQKIIGTEIDPTSHAITNHLYPHANIFNQGYENLALPDNSVDLAIGNPPYGSVKLNFQNKPHLSGKTIANSFMQGTLEQVKPNGLSIMVVSSSFMDSTSADTRKQMAELGDLVGAIRLPNTTFDEAGTAVVADILVFKKHDETTLQAYKDGSKTDYPAWVQSSKRVSDDGVEVNFNPYFDDKIAGEFAFGTGEGGRAIYTVTQSQDIDSALHHFVKSFDKVNPKQSLDEIQQQIDTHTKAMIDSLILHANGETAGFIGRENGVLVQVMEQESGHPNANRIVKRALSPSSVWSDSYIQDLDGRWYKLEDKKDKSGKPIKAKDKDGHTLRVNEKHKVYYDEKDIASQSKLGVRGMNVLSKALGIQGLLENQLRLEQSGASEHKIETNRTELNRAYDEFVAKFGYLNSPNNAKYIDKLPKSNFVLALETSYKKQVSIGTGKNKQITQEEAAGKADILSKRVLAPKANQEKADSPQDALVLSLAYTGGVDLDLMSKLAGQSKDTLIDTLTQNGELYFDPSLDEYVTKDAYLSGNIRQKLANARKHGLTDNIQALQKVLPADVEIENISIRLGMNWLPSTVYGEFAQRILGNDTATVDYEPITHTYTINGTSSHTAINEFGAGGKSPEWILDKLLNTKQIRVTKTVDKKVVFLPDETADAIEMAKTIKSEFENFIYSHPDIDKIGELYNEKHNAIVPQKFDGGHLQFVGKVPDSVIKLRTHQKNAVWRGVTTNAVLYDHAVGSGKAQPLTAKILTPTGWKLMGDIGVGDYVISDDGKPTRVEAVFPQGKKEIFKVMFSDGSVTECCDEHLWFTQTYKERGYAQKAKKFGKNWDCGQGKVRSLNEIRHSLTARLGIKNHTIPIVEPVQFKEQDVPMDAYTLGALLGDGHIGKKAVSFSTKDPQIIGQFVLPSGVRLRKNDNYGRCSSWHFVGTKYGKNPTLTIMRNLGLAGVLAEDKFIPDCYKFNDIDTRLSVLRGLMDADGYVQNKGFATVFGSSSKRLIDDVLFLVQSLGGIATINTKKPTYTYNGEKRQGKTAYVLNIKLPANINPFWLPRKADKVIPKTSYSPTRYIVAVESVGEKEAQCIRVANDSRLYVTDNFIVTHNTFTGIARAMERKRLGLSKKPVLVVPNHMVGQFAQDIYRLYPAANILTAGKNDFAKAKRKRLFGKIATGNYDIIVLPHSSFEFIKLSKDRQMAMLEQEQQKIVFAISETKAQQGKKESLKQLETAKKNIETKLIRLAQTKRHDDEFSFEQMGIDDITVDEAHEFKNLFFTTKMQGIKGLGNPAGSNKAMDLWLKTQYLHQSGGSVAFMTGTPISNSAAEMHAMMRYLMPDTLDEMGLDNFDAWANTYAENTAKFEATEGGQLKLSTRFAREWQNMTSLMSLWQQVTDSVTNDDIKKTYKEETGKEFPLPKVDGGTRQSVVVAPTTAQEEILQMILAGFGAIDDKELSKDEAAVLRLQLMDLATKNALDPRTINPHLQAGGKIGTVVDSVFAIYEQYHDDLGTQIIFLDRSMPKGRGDDKKIREYEALLARRENAIEQENDDELLKVNDLLDKFDENEMSELLIAQNGGFNAYDEIKKGLIARGIPSDEIAFVQDAQTDDDKDALFDQVNAGRVRVIIGSTPRMGAGTNIQQRLVALHHVDAPWKPSDIEQREGRIIRQGNELYNKYGHDNFTVKINAYVTQKTADAKRWDTMAAKLTTINAIRHYKGEHSLDFQDDDEGSSFQEIAALATGNPLMRERVELIAQKDSLARAKLNHQKRQAGNAAKLKQAQSLVASLPKKIEGLIKAKEDFDKLLPKAQEAFDKMGIDIDGKWFTALDKASEYITQKYKTANEKGENVRFVINGQEATSLSAAEKRLRASDIVKKGKTPTLIHIDGTAYSGVRYAINPSVISQVNHHQNDTAIAKIMGFDVLSYDMGKQTLLTLENQNGDELTSTTLDHYATQEKVENAFNRLVDGLPKNLKTSVGQAQEQLARAKDIVNQLNNKTRLDFDKEQELQAVTQRLEEVQDKLSKDGVESQFKDADKFADLQQLLDSRAIGGNRATSFVPSAYYAIKDTKGTKGDDSQTLVDYDDLTKSQQSAIDKLNELPDSDPNKAALMQEIYALDRTGTDTAKEKRSQVTKKATTYELVARKTREVGDDLQNLGYDVKASQTTLKDDSYTAAIKANKGDRALSIRIHRMMNERRANDPTKNGFFVDDGGLHYVFSINEPAIAQGIDRYSDYQTGGSYGKNRPSLTYSDGTDWQEKMRPELARLMDDDPRLAGFIQMANNEALAGSYKNEILLALTAYADKQASRGNALYPHNVGIDGLIDHSQRKVRQLKQGKPYFGDNRPIFSPKTDTKGNIKDNQAIIAGQLARLFDDDPRLKELTKRANTTSPLSQAILIKDIKDYASRQAQMGNALFNYEVIDRQNEAYHDGKMKFSKMGGVVAPISEQANILQGEAVAQVDWRDVNYPIDGNKHDIFAWSRTMLDKQGRVAHNPILGEIELGNKYIRDTWQHGGGNPPKNLAYAIIKDVLEKGVIVAQDNDGKGEDSFFISAPVTITGRASGTVENIVTATVHRKRGSQKIYVHAINTIQKLIHPRVSSATDSSAGIARSLGALEPQARSSRHAGQLNSVDIHNILQKALTYKPNHSHQGGRFGTTFDEVIALLTNRFGKDAIKALQNNGSLKVLSLSQAQDEFGSIPANADGFYVGNTAYLIHDNIHPDMVIPTFLHELGGHGGLQTLMSDTAYQSLLKEFDNLVAKGDTTAIKAKALAHKHSKQAQDEYLPYLITLASRQESQQSGVRRLINRVLLVIKSFVRNKFGIGLPLTVQDMVGLAEKSVRDRARVQNEQKKDPIRFSQETPDDEIALVRKKYKGTPQWLKAPNGEPTNLTTNQWLQVRTPSFKAWFGDWENDPDNASKVLDDNGEPLVVYHGTKRNNRFYAFQNNSQGLHFGTKEQAKARNAGRLIQAFLNIRDIDREDDQGSDWNFTIKYAPQRGIDGFVYENEVEGEGDSYIVLKPNQVKSAKENIGTFDPNNDDIRFSLDESDDSAFARAVDDVFTGHHRIHSKMIKLGHAPKVFVQAGLDDVAMLMDKAKLAKIKADHPEMNASLLKQIPRQLNHPVVIFKNTKESAPKNSYVALTELVADNGDSVIVAIHANKTHNGLEFNKIASIYRRNSGRLYIKNMVKFADVRFVDKQKANRVALELQLLDEDTLSLLFDKAIITKDSTQGNKNSSDSLDPNNDDIRFSLDESDDSAFAKINIQPKRDATNFVQARQIVGGMLNKPLKNKQSGMVATLSRRSLDKMLSGKAVAKSTDSSKHIKAVVNIDMLFENAILGWVEKDKNNADNVLGVHRFFAPLLIDNKAYLTKLTIKELLGSDGNRIYSVETLDIEKSSVPNMVATAQQSELTTRYHGASVAILAQAIDDYNKENNQPFDNFDIKFSRMADFYAQSQEATQKAVDGLSKVAGEFVANPKSFVSENTKQAVKNGVSDHLGKFLQFLGRRQLTELYGKKLDGLMSYNNRVAQMDADSNEKAFKADTLANQWAKVKDSQSLAELMSDVTLTGIDPSVVRQKGVNAVRYGQLKARYDKLSDEAKAVFNQARDDYQSHYQAMHQAMSDRIKRNDKLSDERKANLIAKLDKELKQTQKAFFPLTRFGDYVVVVKDSDGNVVNISRAETRGQADSIRQQLIKDNPNHHVGQVALGRELDIAKLKGIKGLASEFLNDDLGLDDDTHKAYLNSLLDREFATNNVMIKNTAGFSQNARRAYAYHMTRGGHYIAKLRHTDQLQADLERMQASVDDNVNNPDFDHIALQRVVDEMNKRHKLLLNPPSSPISTMATAVGFMWYMGLSPASALVNLSQTLLVGLPMMAAKYGLKNSVKMLGDVSALLAKNKNDLTDILTGDEKKALLEAVRRGVIDRTMAHDLAGVANGEDSGVMQTIKPVMKVASLMFHQAEKFNRQVTFVASYRLAIQKGLSSNEALEQAIDVTYKSHFDYASSNRPRFMQGNWQRVLFLFKQYGQNMIYTLVHNTYQSFKGETAEQRAEARKIMAGILAGHAMTAGVLGLPVVITAPLLAAFSALGGDDDDELTDNETEFRNALATILGNEFSEVIAKGLPRSAGVDLSGRVGLDSLIFPRLQDGLEGQRWGENMMVGAMGAVAGIPVSMAKGVQQMRQGQTAQGIENMTPKALRDPMKAYRYMTDGNVDKSGIEIVSKDNVSTWDVGQQFVGFRSGKFAQAQEVKSAIYQAEQKLNATKKRLKNDYSQAYRDDDKERMNKIWADIQAFNIKYPTQKISKPDLMRSIKARQKRIDNAKDGIYLSKSREHLREYGAFGVE